MESNNQQFFSIDESCKLSRKEILPKAKRNIKIFATFLTIISIALIVYTLINLTFLQQEFAGTVENYGVPSLFILSLLLELIPQLISPVAILTAAILAGMNVYYAIATTVLGSTIGSILGFALGKKYVCKAVNLLTTERSAEKVTKLVNRYGRIIVLITAISPLPFLPVLIGAMNLSKKNFMIYGLLPRAIGIALVASIIRLI